ncbi:hypothetical protein ACFXJ8_21855 [Nonomuraea sp. NPDC059194]|uniref:hypothetical protein n=1 Tax=Nonomuraea sp. NPDC059194 TaxID=3346764 RepID=UPI003695F74C
MNAHVTSAAPEHTELAGAVYGSLLAASVVVGSTAEGGPPSAGELMVLLVCTGVVFWITHVYAQVVGRGYPAKPLTWANLRAVARQEWPLAQASFPPAIAAAFASALGMSDVVAAWSALGVAVASQVAWAVAAAVRIHAGRGVVLLSGLANLVLGLAIVALKTLISGK